jgi:hypothetical protein
VFGRHVGRYFDLSFSGCICQIKVNVFMYVFV